MVADVIKSFDTVDRSLLDCALVRLGLPSWFRKVYFSYHSQHGFYKWVFDALGLLDDLVKQVVIDRGDAGVRRWATWLGEDLGAGPYAWLWPDFVPPSPFLVVKDSVAQTSRILVEPHLNDAEFRKAWMPFFCRSGHPVVTVDQFLSFVGPYLPQEAELDLPCISCQDLLVTARAKQPTACGVGWLALE